MNVKLAAQTFSESCAVALEQLLKDGRINFIRCAATIEFSRMVNNTFDCLNSRSLFSNGFKRPLKHNTVTEMFFFSEAINYFSLLKIQPAGQLIIDSRVKTGFRGFILIDLENLQNIYRHYVKTGYLKYILSYKLSQDHLEILFSCFRAMDGYNNNPNCVQFLSSYKRLLHHNEVTSSAQANCMPIDSTSILTISLAKRISSECNDIEANEQLDLKDIDIDLSLKIIDSGLDHATLYIAGYV